MKLKNKNLKDLEIIDLALFLRKEKILIIADLHIGYEEALNKQGILIPRFQYKETEERLRKILEKTKPKLIIINGDIKHEFGTISETEWRHTLRILDLLLQYGKVILLKGNHDTILGPIAKKRNVEIKDFFAFNDIYICHGHKIPKNKEYKKAKIILIGHEHPAVSVRTEVRSETYKAFLIGKYGGKTLLVQPSFNLVTEGTDVVKEKLLSPFLQQDLSSFEAYLVSDKVYYFGKLVNLG